MMSLLRSLRIFWADVLQICRAYSAGFADARPANTAAGFAQGAARVAPSPWGEGRVEGGRANNRPSLFLYRCRAIGFGCPDVRIVYVNRKPTNLRNDASQVQLVTF